MKLEKFGLEIRCKIERLRVINHWNNVPPAGVESPALEIFNQGWMYFLQGLLGFKQELIQESSVHEVRLDDLGGPFWLYNL